MVLSYLENRVSEQVPAILLYSELENRVSEHEPKVLLYSCSDPLGTPVYDFVLQSTRNSATTGTPGYPRGIPGVHPGYIRGANVVVLRSTTLYYKVRGIVPPGVPRGTPGVPPGYMRGEFFLYYEVRLCTTKYEE